MVAGVPPVADGSLTMVVPPQTVEGSCLIVTVAAKEMSVKKNRRAALKTARLSCVLRLCQWKVIARKGTSMEVYRSASRPGVIAPTGVTVTTRVLVIMAVSAFVIAAAAEIAPLAISSTGPRFHVAVRSATAATTVAVFDLTGPTRTRTIRARAAGFAVIADAIPAIGASSAICRAVRAIFSTIASAITANSAGAAIRRAGAAGVGSRL